MDQIKRLSFVNNKLKKAAIAERAAINEKAAINASIRKNKNAKAAINASLKKAKNAKALINLQVRKEKARMTRRKALKPPHTI
jgi:hypothetical protein